MQNAIAIYAPKSLMKGGQLETLASENGVQIRFLALGGYLPGDLEAIRSKALGSAFLLVGAFESDLQVLAQFDESVSRADRKSIAALLNGGELPWIELYSSRFDYGKATKSKSDREAVDGSVKKDQVALLKGAKSRYILYN